MMPQEIDTDAIRARITGRGESSTVPDREDAVDADVYIGDRFAGSVTLLAHEDGSPGLTTWGSLDNWWNPSHGLGFDLVVDADNKDDVISAIEHAVESEVG